MYVSVLLYIGRNFGRLARATWMGGHASRLYLNIPHTEAIWSLWLRTCFCEANELNCLTNWIISKNLVVEIAQRDVPKSCQGLMSFVNICLLQIESNYAISVSNLCKSVSLCINLIDNLKWLRLLRLTADLLDEPKWYYTLLFTVDKNTRRRQCAHEIALSTGGRNVDR